jgi:hypothetical protein
VRELQRLLAKCSHQVLYKTISKHCFIILINLLLLLLFVDFSLEYVEMLLFENAKLRLAVDEISDDTNRLSLELVSLTKSRNVYNTKYHELCFWCLGC